MKAWRLERLGGALTVEDVPVPEPRPHSVLVRIEAVPLLSYLKQYVEGKLAFYSPPPGKFTLGTNGVGVIEAVGRDVWHLRPGQRVYAMQVAALRRLRNGGQQFVRVEHVHVNDGGQAVIGNVKKPEI